MTSESQSPESLLQQYRDKDGHDNQPGYEYYLKQLLGGIDLTGKRVMEIGSGRGLLSLYCGLQGAEKVVSIEPEMDGSTSGVVQEQLDRIEAMGLKNVEMRREDFNEMEFETSEFDLIIMIAVLNHLHETPINAMKDQKVYDKYVEIVGSLHSLTRPGAVVVATDACRYCLWTHLRRIGYPRSLCLTQRTIEWEIHQQPKVWKQIFLDSGFSSVDISYPVPYRLRSLAPVVNTPIVNYAIKGEFILKAHH